MLWFLSFIQNWIWPPNKPLNDDDFVFVEKDNDPIEMYLSFFLLMHNDRRMKRFLLEK